MRHLRILITFLLLCTASYAIPPMEFNGKNQKEKKDQLSSHLITEFYPFCLPNTNIEKAKHLLKFVLGYPIIKDVDEGREYLKKILNPDFDVSILLNPGFDQIRETLEFSKASEKYRQNYSIWSFMYLYVALIGFYIAAIINFNKKIDLPARLLISSFLFIHSIFILHICLSITNFQYKFPHSHGMSTSFSFLYGPLIYFYFKRITQQYRFKKRDLLHLIPTILLLIYILPIYMLSGEEKLSLMIERNTSGRSFYNIAIIILKLASLIIYGYFLRKLYLDAKKDKVVSKENKIWQKNIFHIHVLYILCYAAYGILLGNNITSGFLYHMQVVSMALMVMYIGYSANVQPNVFSGGYAFDKGLFLKYKKSGLTESLSIELKENLIHLFNHKKIYKENDISLDIVALRLNTTRHNASQVINEHFQMNFHELVNKFRIQEAMEILNTDHLKNLNIIDVAYEVGYNNKVTFNKAFKKETNLTPSLYQKESIAHEVTFTK